jgi:hypothetical protein
VYAEKWIKKRVSRYQQKDVDNKHKKNAAITVMAAPQWDAMFIIPSIPQIAGVLALLIIRHSPSSPT